ncbi:LOW QUALITY PROTEIN: hypothetical protein PHMEG_00023613 [Phytophthora megakarya]|uniref:CCHC-type domain-containing protein n=1 Tax=Phytophthora megakarya TaxID=4795 RepID=A0A225VFQ7_9STRA|nr:LOW QUALITY PROTEIN: hypothetical protein PHMEG_00023613 [Phytophthora megakarya]
MVEVWTATASGHGAGHGDDRHEGNYTGGDNGTNGERRTDENYGNHLHDTETLRTWSSLSSPRHPEFRRQRGLIELTWRCKASGQGEWTDHALYFILGNKLMESPAMVNGAGADLDIPEEAAPQAVRTPENIAAAELRVNNRSRLYGESYNDFAEGLQNAVDRNRVSEREFLAQYYRNLDRTTRQLVRMKPTPKTLEEAVAKTNKIDDPSDNITQGISNVGQTIQTAPQAQLATVTGTTGQTVLTSRTDRSSCERDGGGTTQQRSREGFTNQQAIWNDYAGIYERPPGRKWNGRFWEKTTATKKAQRRSPSTPAAETKKTRAKRNREEPTDDEPADKPSSRKRKTTANPVAETAKGQVARVAGVQRQEANSSSRQECYRCGSKEHYSTQCPDAPRCFACGKPGRYAKECTDPVAKAKNDEYLQQRATRTVTNQENDQPTSDGEVEPSDNTDPTGSLDLRRERRRHRRQRKAANRRRALAARTRERQRYYDVAREVDERRKLLRRQQVDEALAKLRERRQQPENGEGSGVEPEHARASLVQQRNERDSGDGRHDRSVVHVGSDDGLPTAAMMIKGTVRSVKLDSCARYTVAGTDWMAYGSKASNEAPVDYVEGIGGFLLDVVGVWRFRFRSVFGELIVVDACIVKGCTDEFLLGVDSLKNKGANMDFRRNEMRYRDNGRAVVIPFRTHDNSGGWRVAAVRMVGTTHLAARTVTSVQVSVTAKDGERGMFVPTYSTGSVLLAATVTTAQGGRAWVPAVNANGAPARLPNKKDLGTWSPVDDDMTVLSMNKAMSRKRLDEWLKELGDDETPLNNEEDMHIGVEEPHARNLAKKLLRVYRKLSVNASDCPPATALNINHHIDTGDTAPIMQK